MLGAIRRFPEGHGMGVEDRLLVLVQPGASWSGAYSKVEPLATVVLVHEEIEGLV